MEWRLFDGEVPYVSTHDFHEGRPRAAHLEEGSHNLRLYAAAGAVDGLADGTDLTISDLGCGDGGLLSILTCPNEKWGYDFHEPNAWGWQVRGVKAELLDVFGKDWGRVRFGDIIVLTEVLEHLADPHGILRKLPGKYIVASSPRFETAESHCGEHAWAWDMSGYRDLFTHAGWSVECQRPCDWSQILVASRPHLGETHDD